MFPGLHERLSEGIASLGGQVFPKLNWSSPQASFKPIQLLLFGVDITGESYDSREL